MKKYIVLTSILALAACGGGGGVPMQTSPGHTMRPGTVVSPDKSDKTNTDLTMMKTMVVDDSNGGFSKLIQETLVSAYQNHDISVVANHNASTTRGASIRAAATYQNDNNDYMKNICKSERDCNQEVFENMKKILIDQNLENATAQELRNALILAGFEKDLHGMWDDIKELQKYIQEHPDEIKASTDKIYNDYTVTLKNAKLILADTDPDEKTYIRLVLDDDKKINGLAFNADDDEGQIVSRQGTDNKFVAEPEHLYVYGLRIGTDCTKGACAPEQGQEITFTSDEKIEDVEVIRAKLLDLFTIAYNNGQLNGLHGGPNGGFQPGDDEMLKEYAINFIKNLPAEEFANTDMDGTKYDHVFYTELDTSFETDYQSYAKDLGLSYSDFGKLNVHDISKYSSRNKIEVSDEIKVFAGGYDAKKINKQDMTDKMTFTKGRAVGGVNFKENDNWTGANPETVTLTLDSTDVELTFDNGNETLTAKFANWYDVTMETKINGSNNSNKLTFTADGKTIDNKFKFRDQDTYVVENFTGEQMILANGTEHKVVDQGTNEGTTGISNGAFDIGYYGDTGTPTEATGFIKYGENLPNGDQDGSRVKELDVTIGFGVTNP